MPQDPFDLSEQLCVEPIFSAGLTYSAHRTMPILPWTPHTGCGPI